MPYNSPAAGLKIDFWHSVFPTALKDLVVRNTTSDATVVEFEMVWTLGEDQRLEPETKIQPAIHHKSGVYVVAIRPGQRYLITDFGLNIPATFQHIKDRDIGPPVLRFGISRIKFADGTEQVFDFLRDERAKRTEQPIDQAVCLAMTSSACR